MSAHYVHLSTAAKITGDSFDGLLASSECSGNLFRVSGEDKSSSFETRSVNYYKKHARTFVDASAVATRLVNLGKYDNFDHALAAVKVAETECTLKSNPNSLIVPATLAEIQTGDLIV